MSKPLDFVTLSLSDQDLRDQVAYALTQNVFNTHEYGHDVEFRVDDLAWDDDNNRWEVAGGFDVTERE